MYRYAIQQVISPHARSEPPWLDACQHHPPTNYDVLWEILGYLRGQQICSVSMSCDISRHTQCHWLEWLNSQPAVYQRKETGNQFPNAVWAYSPPLWYTRHCADVDRNVHGHVWMYSWQTENSPNKDQMASIKNRERLPNINLASEAMIEDCHLMALSKWVQLSWGRLWFLIT